jgi:LacI family transcriptional regulator
LRSKRTRTLALLVPDITNVFWTTVARGVEDAAQSRGYSVVLCNTDESTTKQLRYLDVVISQRVDGVIIAPYDSNAQHLAKLRQRTIPTVVIDRRIDGWDVDTVSGDSLSGARALVRHLLGLGHRRIALVSGPANTSTAEDRVAGYCMALAEAGLPVDPALIKRGEFRSSSGEHLTYQLLDATPPPMAIFAANNSIAIGVLKAIEKRGLRVPHDVALVCFDDLPDTSRFFPFLTVAVQPAYDMGLHAAQLLLSRLDAEVVLQPRHVVLPARLIIRRSCGNKLKENGDVVFSLPLPGDVQAQSFLVKQITFEEMQHAATCLKGLVFSIPRQEVPQPNYDKSDVNRLLKVLRHQEADRVPHLEFWITSQSVFEYVLEHKLEYDIVDASLGGQSIAPEDHVEFAQRLGMDAVVCNFSWRPNNLFRKAADGSNHYVGGSVKSWADLADLEPPPALADQLSYL